MISSGEKREYLLYVPRSYDRTKPAPLVISNARRRRMAGASK